MAKAASGTYVFNERKILDASHVVVFCENRDGRRGCSAWWIRKRPMAVSPPGRKAANHKGRTFFADMHRKELKDDDQWMAKQVYLNVGNSCWA